MEKPVNNSELITASHQIIDGRDLLSSVRRHTNRRIKWGLAITEATAKKAGNNQPFTRSYGEGPIGGAVCVIPINKTTRVENDVVISDYPKTEPPAIFLIRDQRNIHGEVTVIASGLDELGIDQDKLTYDLEKDLNT